MALASRGIGAQRHTNYVIQQRTTAAREADPRFSSQTSVVNVNGTPITNRRDQIMLGEKYSPNASAVGRFDRAAARIAGRTAGTRAEQAARQAQPNYIMLRQRVQPLQPNYIQRLQPNYSVFGGPTRVFGTSIGALGGTRFGISSDGNERTYWSAPSLR